MGGGGGGGGYGGFRPGGDSVTEASVTTPSRWGRAAIATPFTLVGALVGQHAHKLFFSDSAADYYTLLAASPFVLLATFLAKSRKEAAAGALFLGCVAGLFTAHLQTATSREAAIEAATVRVPKDAFCKALAGGNDYVVTVTRPDGSITQFDCRP